MFPQNIEVERDFLHEIRKEKICAQTILYQLSWIDRKIQTTIIQRLFFVRKQQFSEVFDIQYIVWDSQLLESV